MIKITAITATEVPAGRQMHQDGRVTKLFTATCNGASSTVDLSTYFDNVYSVRSWDVSDGTDASAFVTTAITFLPAITITTDKGAVYLTASGIDISSTGGST